MENLGSFDSSSIAWARYDPVKKILHLGFKGNNEAYRYFQVPLKKWKELKAAASKGQYINLNIKPFHQFTSSG